MLKRKIWTYLESWKRSNHALLIDGARQVGKTFILREFAKENFGNMFYLNLYEDKRAVSVLKEATNAQDFLFRLSTFFQGPMPPGDSVIFIDEIQQLKDFDLVTMMKFLVDEGSYRYMFSGSMLGVEMYDMVSSWPVGYLSYNTMYPMDFEEFLWAKGVQESVMAHVRKCFDERIPVEDFLHKMMMAHLTQYLLIGGMPEAVQTYVNTNSLADVTLAQEGIMRTNKKDVARYADENEKLKIKEIYDLVSVELNSRTKRFRLNDIQTKKKNEDVSLSFTWLDKAGVAIPVYTASEPVIPLKASSSHTLLKLFHGDVGMLTYSLMEENVRERLLSGDMCINYGSIYENLCAQLLLAHGFDGLYYYNSKKNGEVDFLVEHGGKVLPIEIKSGKDYQRHVALDNLMNIKNYDIPESLIFCDDNVKVKGNFIYLPIYMIEFLRKRSRY